MSKGSEAVKKWRQNTKIRMVEAMGGKCQICGYDKCYEAMEFHHFDPKEKEFNVGRIRANPISWIKITEELKKCILICNRCHSEVHYNKAVLPETYETFNEEYENYLEKQREGNIDNCPVCGNKKSVNQKTCSSKCAGSLSWRVDWTQVNLEEELKKGKSYTKIADELNISNASVKKRCEKLGLHYLNKFRKNTDV